MIKTTQGSLFDDLPVQEKRRKDDEKTPRHLRQENVRAWFARALAELKDHEKWPWAKVDVEEYRRINWGPFSLRFHDAKEAEHWLNLLNIEGERLDVATGWGSTEWKGAFVAIPYDNYAAYLGSEDEAA